MKVFIKSLVIFCCSLGIFSAQAASALHYQRMVVFGDSYSDNGNVFKLSNSKYPNSVRYFQGRFSNGPVWTEYLAKNFNIIAAS